MGSHNLHLALEGFGAHCDRYALDRRPTYWCQYVDMWGDARGELGIPDPTGVDDPRHRPDATVFALLAPWLAIPTMAEAWVVVDRLECLWVIGVRATSSGYFSPVWEIVYRMEDDGTLTPGEPTPISMPPVIGAGIAAALKGRAEQKLWDVEYDLDTIIPVVEGMLNG